MMLPFVGIVGETEIVCVRVKTYNKALKIVSMKN